MYAFDEAFHSIQLFPDASFRVKIACQSDLRRMLNYHCTVYPSDSTTILTEFSNQDFQLGSLKVAISSAGVMHESLKAKLLTLLYTIHHHLQQNQSFHCGLSYVKKVTIEDFANDHVDLALLVKISCAHALCINLSKHFIHF